MKRFILLAGFVMLMTRLSWADVGFVQQVIDGTTFKLLSGETVKMIGVDFPKTGDAALDEQHSKDIAGFIRGFISGNLVELEYDVKQKDPDGNLLAYVWFEYPSELDLKTMPVKGNYEVTYLKDNEGEGHFLVFLNATMIKSGFAKPSFESPNIRHAELFEKIYKEQQSNTEAQLANARVDIQMSGQ